MSAGMWTRCDIDHGGGVTFTARTAAALSAASNPSVASIGGATRYAIASPGLSSACFDR